MVIPQFTESEQLTVATYSYHMTETKKYLLGNDISDHLVIAIDIKHSMIIILIMLLMDYSDGQCFGCQSDGEFLCCAI